jgi:G:T-mismatch repair DNA endonuclease (very short patch repair protein)
MRLVVNMRPRAASERLEGWEFHHGRASFERDRAKWAELTARGYRIIVVTHRRLNRERPKVAATLRAVLGPAPSVL